MGVCVSKPKTSIIMGDPAMFEDVNFVAQAAGNVGKDAAGNTKNTACQDCKGAVPPLRVPLDHQL